MYTVHGTQNTIKCKYVLNFDFKNKEKCCSQICLFQDTLSIVEFCSPEGYVTVNQRSASVLYSY